MQKVLYGILLLQLISLQVFAQQDHFFRCIEIQDNNSARLTWQEYAGNDFVNYEIFHSQTLQGPYQQLTTITAVTQNQYTHNGIDAVNNNHFYFVRINKSHSGLQDSDTLQTIRLRVVPVGTAESIGWLRWNPPHVPSIPGNGYIFNIYRKYSYGNWEQIGATTETVFYDTILVCRDLINYRVEVEDLSFCNSVSNTHGAFLTDHTQPPIPVLDSVSITEEGYAILGWEKSPDSSVVGYKILKRFEDDLIKWDTVSSVWGINNTVWVDSLSDPCSTIEYYKILSVDSCNKFSGGSGIAPGQVDEYMQSMLLNELTYNPCSSEISLSWTPYINMRYELQHYKIYVSINGDALEPLTTVPPGSLTYTHTHVDNSAKHTYFIQAVSNQNKITSSSCKQAISTYYPGLPGFIYLNYVSVLAQAIHLKTYVDTEVDSRGYIVERSEDLNGMYQKLDTIQVSNDSLIQYIDSTANPSQQQYYYRVIATDSCGKEDLVSNFGTNILLEVTNLQNQLFELTWNKYEDWEAGVSKYNIYRINTVTQQEELIESLNPGTNTFQIDLSLNPGDASKAYFVEAIKEDGGEFNFRDTARSNILSISIEAEIYMPNAFAPGQSTQELKPLSRFIEGGNYSFRIFNRWGQMIFESKDPGKGWDGRYKGDYAPMGVYFYIIHYQNPESSIQKKGSITLIY